MELIRSNIKKKNRKKAAICGIKKKYKTHPKNRYNYLMDHKKELRNAKLLRKLFTKQKMFFADLVKYTEEILNGKFHFLCSVFLHWRFSILLKANAFLTSLLKTWKNK